MKTAMRIGLAMAAAAMTAQAAAEVVFYEREGFEGRSYTAAKQIANLERQGFNDRASSAVVLGSRWEVCESDRFEGRCRVLRPGRYPSLAAMGLNDRISSVRSLSADARVSADRFAPEPANAAAEIVFYERESFEGRSYTAARQVANLGRQGFNDRASSAVVLGSRWEVCENIRFEGRCRVLRPGRYPSLAAMGLNDRISSVRSLSANASINANRFAPEPVPVYDNRRRGNERMYEANVTSVRAVVATSGQRCWVEREQFQGAQEQGGLNVPGAVVGALIGGVLGHQVGSGSGNTAATVGGAVAGGAVGAHVGRTSGQPAQFRDVQRCENDPSQARPEYWDVTYSFRGQEHRIQTSTPPGRTVTVNERGEPRA